MVLGRETTWELQVLLAWVLILRQVDSVKPGLHPLVILKPSVSLWQNISKGYKKLLLLVKQYDIHTNIFAAPP